MISIYDKLSQYLPQYSAWNDVTIKQLLNMTSHIPTYMSENFIKQVFGDLNRIWKYEDLIALVYPNTNNEAPCEYSNTNYILCAMILEKILCSDLSNILENEIFIPYELKNTHYFNNGSYPKNILNFMPHSYFARISPAINTYNNNISYAGPSGGIISNTYDINKWVRLLFSQNILANTQQSEMESLTMMCGENTGKPVTEVDENPEYFAFGLGVMKQFAPKFGGQVWKYDAATFGSRFFFVYNPNNKICISIATNSVPIINSMSEHSVLLLAESIYDIISQ